MNQAYFVSYFWTKNEITGCCTGYGRNVISLPRKPPSFIDLVRAEKDLCGRNEYSSVTILTFVPIGDDPS